MRSLSEYDFLSAEQKRQMQALVMQTVDRNYSEATFKELVRRAEQILYQPWSKKLEETFRETVALIEHMRSQNIQDLGRKSATCGKRPSAPSLTRTCWRT